MKFQQRKYRFMPSFRMLMTSVIALTVACGAVPALGQEQPVPTRSAPGDDSLFGDNRDKGDAQEKLQIDGRISLGGEFLGNEDLTDGPDNLLATLGPEARLDLTYRPDDDIEAYVSFGAGLDHQLEDGNWTTDATTELREAYLLIDDSIADDIEFQIGRQDFEDGREFLYDEQLDGVRLAYDHQAWRIELAWAREALIPKDLTRRERGRDRVDNFIFHAEYKLTDDWDIAAYVLKQEDRRPGNISPTHFGIQSEGTLGGGFGHWFDFSLQRGKIGARKLRANAVDAGLIYTFPGAARPAIFAGYARGSGGGNATTSREFRQSGLQDNEDRITGRSNVRYYGEALDPDLSNIKIFTLGAGIRPNAASSLEIVAHKYRQVDLDDEDIRGSPISATLNGNSRDIGSELDAIFAVRLFRGIGLEAKLGWFMPGKAFDPPARKDALFGKLRLVYRF